MDALERQAAEFCREHDIQVKLSYAMPSGYETAYGTYDVTVNTLFLNKALLKDGPAHEALFYLFHELRHGLQYLRPALFGSEIQESLYYVILYHGGCFKLVDGAWQACVLEGAPDDFTRAYMSLPYELDANAYAYERTKAIVGDTDALKALYAAWTPKERLPYEALRLLFGRIDEQLMK